MMGSRYLPRFVPFILVVLLFAACGGSGEEAVETTLAATTTTGVATTATTSAPATTEASSTTTTVAPTTTVPSMPIAVDRGIAYTTDLERTYGGYVDVFYPTDPGPWPVVVLLHGAGDPVLDPTAETTQRTTDGCQPSCEVFYDGHATHLAEHGTVVFAFRYDWRAPGEMRRLVDDISCMGPFVATRAEDYGGDAARTVVVGHSRGATLGAAEAFSDFATPTAAVCVEQSELRPTTIGFVGLSGDYHLHGFPAPADDTKIVIPIVGITVFAEADEIGNTGVTAGEAYRSASGYAWLDTDTLPPIELFYGTQEADAAPADAERFAEALQAYGHNPTVTIYEGEHWQSLYLPESESSEPTEANLQNLNTILNLAHN